MLGGLKRLMASALLAFFTGGVALGLWMAPQTVVGPDLPPVDSIFQHVHDTTVQIRNEDSALGSGVVIHSFEYEDENGQIRYTSYVLTADHVVQAFPTSDVLIGHWEDNVMGIYPATIKHRTWEDIRDLALVEVSNLRHEWFSTPIIDEHRASELAPGQEIWLAGYPTIGRPQVSHGWIQDLGYSAWEPFLRLSASISYGNSGGPVFLPDGRLIGIGVRVHISAGLPVWTISRAVHPLHIYSFLRDAGVQIDG